MAVVVVTGASGFVGRTLVRQLRDRAIDVIAVSRTHIPNGHRVGDYADSPSGDVMIHLAETANRAQSNALGEAAIQESVRVTNALARRFQGRLVYASSSLVYGDQHSHPCPTTAGADGNDSYCRAKLANEAIVLDAGGCVVRLSNLIGRRMARTTVVTDIVDQIPGSGPVRVRDASPVRDFLSVGDAASALRGLAASRLVGLFNVGSGVATSVRELAEAALAVAGQGDRPVLATAPAGRWSYNVLDISATCKALSWRPERALRDELAQMLDERRSHSA